MDQKEIAFVNTPEPMNNSIIIESDVQFRAWNLRLVFINILEFYERVNLRLKYFTAFIGENKYEIKTGKKQ